MSELADLLAAGWRLLREGAALTTSPARFVALATVDETGAPQVRTVALRRADRHAATLEFHTDARSVKMAELRGEPRAALLAWHPGPRLQIRATGRLLPLADTFERWAAIPAPARGPYGHLPPPGTPIAASDAFEVRPDPSFFAAVAMQLDALDIVDIASREETAHRRARYSADAGWRGQWRVP